MNKYLGISTPFNAFLALLPLEEKFVGEGKDWLVIHDHVIPGLWHRLGKILLFPSPENIGPDQPSAHAQLALWTK